MDRSHSPPASSIRRRVARLPVFAPSRVAGMRSMPRSWMRSPESASLRCVAGASSPIPRRPCLPVPCRRYLPQFPPFSEPSEIMPAVAETLDTVRAVTGSTYKWGFETDLEMDIAPKGLSEDTIRLISAKKEEPAWLLEWRLAAYAAWLTMTEPNWAKVGYPKIDYQDIHYYAAPKRPAPKSLADVDPELLAMYEKLGIPLKERAILAGVVSDDQLSPPQGANIAVDAVFDSVSVAT